MHAARKSTMNPLEPLEPRTMHAVHPASIVVDDYVELAITKAGRLIVHADSGHQAVSVDFGSRSQLLEAAFRNTVVDRGDGGGYVNVVFYAGSLGRLEQMTFAPGTYLGDAETALANTFGEPTEPNAEYFLIRDRFGLNLIVHGRFVKSLWFDMGAGDDLVSLDRDFNRPTVILGGSGNDTLISARAGDLLVGGRGNDRLVSRASGQTLLGGAGRDHFFVTSGTNEIRGGAGDDFFEQDVYEPGAGYHRETLPIQ